MSRRASRIQRAVTHSGRIPPAIVRPMNVVTPTSATVIANASKSGSMLGPGRWISSPAGGISGSSGLIARTSVGSRHRRRASDEALSCDVDRRGDERHAEHEEADGGDDEPGADVLACE